MFVESAARGYQLEELQKRATSLIVVLLWAFVPVVAITASLHDQAWLMPALGAVGLALIGTLVRHFAGARQSMTHYVIAVVFVGVVSILVAVANGPWQIDFHMLYFTALAVLVVFCDWRVLLIGATATAVHHLSLNFFIPFAIFPDGASFARVLFHAAVVVFQTAVLMWLAHRLSRLFSAFEILQKETQTQRQQAAEDLADKLEYAVGDSIGLIDSARRDMQDHSSTVRDHAKEAEEQIQIAREVAAESAVAIDSGTAAIDELARSTSEVAQQFRETVTVAGMAAQRSRETTERVQSLDQSATNISEIIEMISGIAEQTNLLALNATIESARAGDAGKGFAVVAQEVKSLAAQTATATAEISTRIDEMQVSTKDTVSAINEIGDVIRRIDITAAGVSSAIDEQNTSTQSIGEIMTQASDAARRIAAMVDHVNDSTKKTSHASQTLVEAAGGAANHSKDLNEAMTSIAHDIRHAV